MSVSTISIPGFAIGVDSDLGGIQISPQNIYDNRAARLGRLESGSVSLLLAFPRVVGVEGAVIVPFVVDGKKNVNTLKPMKAEEDEDIVWERKISVFYSPPRVLTLDRTVGGNEGLSYTRYPDNHVKVARIARDGKIEVWEIAVISQGGDFFVTIQRLYEAQAFGGKDSPLKIPTFDIKWPQLAALLRTIVTTLNLSLETKPVQEEVEKDLAEGLQEGQARVVWFNSANGVGSVVLQDGSQARVHWSQISKRELGRRYLIAGENVAYKELRTPTLSPSYRQTGFQKEVVGVILV